MFIRLCVLLTLAYPATDVERIQQVFFICAHSKVREMKDSKTVHFYNKYSCGSRVQKVEENKNKISAISQIAILKQEEETLTWNSNNQST